MAAREIRAKFTGPFEELPGSLFTERKELADTTLNGSADMAVALTVPKVGPTELLDVSGTATLEKSTIAGMAIDSGQATGSFANQTADIKELVLTGPDRESQCRRHARASATPANRSSRYDVAVTNLEPLAKRFDQPLAGSAHIVGEASGPAANLTLAGKLGANRLRYGTTVDALTANSTYTVQLPNFDIEQARSSGRDVRDVRHGCRPESSARDGEDGLRKQPAAVRHHGRGRAPVARSRRTTWCFIPTTTSCICARSI